jgi:transposase
MSLEGHTTGEIANHLQVHHRTVSLWIDHWNQHGQEGLREGHRSGRPNGLEPEEQEKLCEILDSGPVVYGLETGIWSSPLVGQVIQEEFGRWYHPDMCANRSDTWATRCNGRPLDWCRPMGSKTANRCATPTPI